MTTAEVDAYLAALGEPRRGTLDALRATILELLPGADQGLSYGCPAFRLEGKALAGFAAYEHHLSYLPHSGSVLDEVAGEVQDYECSKGALRFAVDEPLPRSLVATLIDARMRELGMPPPPRA